MATAGLPARGKTHLAHAIQRYLRWLGVKCSVFSLGNARREVLGSVSDLPDDYFADGPKKPGTHELRRTVLSRLQEKVEEFFQRGGQVAVYDASNTKRSQRQTIVKRFEAQNVQVMFLESLCDDPKVIEDNIKYIVQFSPDFQGWDTDAVIHNLHKRISLHEQQYEPIERPTVPHIQLLNLGQRIVVNNVQGYLQNRIVFFLMNIHDRNRIIYFARAGEALIEHLYKADAELSALGHQYAEELCHFVMSLRQGNANDGSASLSQLHNRSWISPHTQPLSVVIGDEKRPLQVWSSPRRRSQLTAEPFRMHGCRIVERTRLAEMNPGVVDGMSEAEIRERFPCELEKKALEPYSFRFPRAESYHDLAVRLEPIIFELERARDDVLIIAQSSVLRCLIAYLQGNKPQEIPEIQVREGDLVEIWPQAYGVSTRVYSFWDPELMREERDRELAGRTGGIVTPEGHSSPAP